MQRNDEDRSVSSRCAGDMAQDRGSLRQAAAWLRTSKVVEFSAAALPRSEAASALILLAAPRFLQVQMHNSARTSKIGTCGTSSRKAPA